MRRFGIVRRLRKIALREGARSRFKEGLCGRAADFRFHRYFLKLAV
jgi:hypothetical protein